MKKFPYNKIISLLLIVSVLFGLLLYIPKEESPLEQTQAYLHNKIPAANYLLLDSFENHGTMPDGGTRDMKVGYATTSHGCSSGNGVEAVKGVSYGLITANVNGGHAGSPCTLWGRTVWSKAHNLTSFTHISFSLYIGSSYLTSHTSEDFTVFVRFTDTDSGEDGAGSAIALTSANVGKWTTFNWKISDLGSNSNVFSWDNVKGYTIREFYKQTVNMGTVKIAIDNIFAYKNNDFVGPTIESFEDIGATADSSYRSYRIGNHARGWTLNGTGDSYHKIINTDNHEGDGHLVLAETKNVFHSVRVETVRAYGPQLYIRFKNPINFQNYDKIEFELKIETFGSLCQSHDVKLMVNFITTNRQNVIDCAEDDGFDSIVTLNDVAKGSWQTIELWRDSSFMRTAGVTSNDWKYIDGVTLRIISDKNISTIANTFANGGSNGALVLHVDDLRVENTSSNVFNNSKSLRLTNMDKYNDYGLTPAYTSEPTYSNSAADKYPHAITSKAAVYTTVGSNAGTNSRWKVLKYCLPTTRNISGYSHLVVEFYLSAAPAPEGVFEIQLNTHRYSDDQSVKHLYVTGHSEYKKGWNRLIIPVSSFSGTGFDKTKVRVVRFAYVVPQSYTTSVTMKLMDIYVTNDVNAEDTMPIIDSFKTTSGDNYTTNYSTTSYGTNSGANYSRAVTNYHTGATIHSKDNSYMTVTTASKTLTPTTNQHFVNGQLNMRYENPKDFRQWSTIELNFYSNKSFASIGGTFEVNFLAYGSTDESDGYNCRIAASDIVQGWNILRINRYALRPINGEGGHISYEDHDYGDWKHIKGFRITHYITSSASSISSFPFTWYFDSMYMTDYHYYEDGNVKTAREKINTVYNTLTNGYNSESAIQSLRTEYNAIATYIINHNADKTWRGFSYDKQYYGGYIAGKQSYVSSTSSPYKKPNDGYDYYDFESYFKANYPTVTTRLNYIRNELQKESNMSLVIRFDDNRTYNNLSSTETPTVTANSVFTTYVLFDITNGNSFTSAALTGGIDPWVYLTNSSGTAVNFPVGTLITLRRNVSSTSSENYKFKVTSATSNIKFSQFTKETATSGTAAHSDFSSSFPTSDVSYIIIVDLSQCSSRLSAATYKVGVNVASTGTAIGSKGNIYAQGSGNTTVSNVRTFDHNSGSLQGSVAVSNVATYRNIGTISAKGNIVVSSATGTDNRNANRKITVVAHLTDASGNYIAIPKGATVTATQGGTSKAAQIRLNRYIYTGVSVGATTQGTVTYTLSLNLGTAQTKLAAGSYKLVVTAYNCLDVSHPFSGDVVGTLTHSFSLLDSEFYASLPNDQTFIDLSGGDKTLNITTVSTVSNGVTVKLEMQKKNSNGTYETISPSGKFSITTTYASLSSNVYTLTATGRNGTIPISVTASGLSKGTYRALFRVYYNGQVIDTLPVSFVAA